LSSEEAAIVFEEGAGAATVFDEAAGVASRSIVLTRLRFEKCHHAGLPIPDPFSLFPGSSA